MVWLTSAALPLARSEAVHTQGILLPCRRSFAHTLRKERAPSHSSLVIALHPLDDDMSCGLVGENDRIVGALDNDLVAVSWQQCFALGVNDSLSRQ